MKLEQALRLIAGIVVLTSTILAVTVHPNWLLLTGFAGINLLQSGLTNWCPMVWILQKAGMQRV